MRLYIAGSVTGYADLNRPMFDLAASCLKAAGYDTLVPHSFVPPDATGGEAMELCLERLKECDGIALLEGWENSVGAWMELTEARAHGMESLPFTDWISASAFKGGDAA